MATATAPVTAAPQTKSDLAQAIRAQIAEIEAMTLVNRQRAAKTEQLLKSFKP